MQTTFKNLFSEWDDDLLSIPENTICENVGISIQTIRNNTLSQIHRDMGDCLDDTMKKEI